MSASSKSFAAAAFGLAALAAAAGPGVTVLHAFDYDDGQYPEGGLLYGRDGRLYGTTYAGGSRHLGTVFAVSTRKVHAVLHSFDGRDGNSLDAGLVQRVDGSLFGTTPQGSISLGGVSTNFGGTAFTLAPDGSGFATLRRFAGNGLPDGAMPGTLVDGGDGYFYGAARSGGSHGVGSVFKLAPDGALGTLTAIDPASGSYPGAMLTLGSDGRLYGSLQYGPGNDDNGALFRVGRDGALAIVHAFGGADGSAPSGALVESDGSFYGVTGGGGAAGRGTVFRMAADGTLETLHAFNGDDGASPVGPLARGADGTLYGLTFGGGAQGGGTIFRITPDGAFMTLHRLVPADGTHPVAGPILGDDGLLYGAATQYGGAPGASGSVFQFDPLAPQPAELDLSKHCYNEFNTCFKPINTTVGVPYDVIWSSANLDACEASGAWSGATAPAGRLHVTPLQRGAFTYRLRCTGPGGASRKASITVTVG